MAIADLIREAGVVGCGGAGFPTHAKLKGPIEYYIVNGAECEPLLRTDRYIMTHHAPELVEALTALQKDGKLRILSSPSLTTMHNQEAITEDGRKVPYVTTETSGGVVSRAVKFEKVTLQLKVKPVVIDGKTMRMEIYVEKSELHPTDKVEGNPVILTKRTETKLIVQDGETIVISGLTKQTLSESDAGVPWFKDIPVLGWLFKEQGKSDAMDEVLIFMTPTIVKPEVVAGIQEGAEPKAAPPAASVQ